jgi:hypothetical protein
MKFPAKIFPLMNENLMTGHPVYARNTLDHPATARYGAAISVTMCMAWKIWNF